MLVVRRQPRDTVETVTFSEEAQKLALEMFEYASKTPCDLTLMHVPDVCDDGISLGPQLIICTYEEGSRPAAGFHSMLGFQVYIPDWCASAIVGKRITLNTALDGKTKVFSASDP